MLITAHGVYTLGSRLVYIIVYIYVGIWGFQPIIVFVYGLQSDTSLNRRKIRIRRVPGDRRTVRV